MESLKVIVPFLQKNDPEKRLQLLIRTGFIVNIFDFLMLGKKFLNKNHANFDNQINDSFTFETKGLAMYFFKVTSLLEILLLGSDKYIF